MTQPTGMPEIDGNSFQVTIRQHTSDAEAMLGDPQTVRDVIGEALDAVGLQEEIDYTLEVHRVYTQLPHPGAAERK